MDLTVNTLSQYHHPGLMRGSLFVLACVAISFSYLTAAFAQTTTSQLCQNLVTHTPNADVAYSPESDVHGRYVAPADMPNSYNNQSYLPKTYNVLITVDQAAKLNLPANLPYKAEAIAAQVQVQPNGVVSINGQTINAEQQQVLCGGR